MGIKGLTKLLATHAPKSMKEEKLETYKGKRIAIDVSRSVYEFLVTKKHNEDCKLLLTLMGIPVLQAPSEAEAECASLCKVGKVDAAASDDTDLLAFGTPRFLRHLTDSAPRKNPVIEFELSKVLDELNLSMDQFVDMCILCGCSYCESIGGIGPQTSLKLIQEHGSIEKILDNIDKDRFQIPVHWPYLQARSIFKEPQITPLEYQSKFEWSAPDEEGLKKLLVDENGFNFDRIMKVIKKIKSIKSTS